MSVCYTKKGESYIRKLLNENTKDNEWSWFILYLLNIIKFK